MTVWERLRNPCGLRAGAKQISVDAMLPLLVVPVLAVIAAQAVICTIVVFLATPILVYYLHHNFLRFLLRTKFFLMWTITSVLMLMLVFEMSVVPLLEILPEENAVFIACVVGGMWCGYKAKQKADAAAQEGVVSLQGLELGEGSGELCTTCRRRAPPKAYHCRLCQTCILNREYHCKWYKNPILCGELLLFDCAISFYIEIVLIFSLQTLHRIKFSLLFFSFFQAGLLHRFQQSRLVFGMFVLFRLCFHLRFQSDYDERLSSVHTHWHRTSA